MRKVRQLSPADSLFVGGETPKVYQHTAGLILLDASDRPEFGFEVYRQHVIDRYGQIPQFRWKLHEVPLGLDLPYWVEDENFSFDHHIRRIAVPAPGDREALAELVSYLYSRHLDRERPLWEAWFIEGLEGGRYAIFQKQHHCMMDGEGARKVGEMMVDLEPDAPPKKADPSIANAQPGEIPERWRESLTTLKNLYAMPLRAGREAYEAARFEFRRARERQGLSREKHPVPLVSFNADMGSDRGLVFGSLSLADIKAVKDHFGVTINDVVLALMGGSLRSYLLQEGELPDDSLRTSIAVSLRTEEDDEFSNRVTNASVTLGTALEDPVRRLQAISGETAEAKERAHAGGKGLMEVLQLMPPGLIGAVLTLTPPEQVAQYGGSNIIVSNVRGSSQQSYIGGARQVATYPMSIILPGGGINVTCVSYLDQIDFGITIAPELVPGPWRLIDGLQVALDEYLAVVSGKGKPRRKKAAARRKPAGARKKSTSAGKIRPTSGKKRKTTRSRKSDQSS